MLTKEELLKYQHDIKSIADIDETIIMEAVSMALELVELKEKQVAAMDDNITYIDKSLYDGLFAQCLKFESENRALKEQVKRWEDALNSIINELATAQLGYPTPVIKAHKIALEALSPQQNGDSNG